MSFLDKVREKTRIKSIYTKVSELENLIFELCPPDANRQDALRLLQNCSSLATKSIKEPKFS